VKAMANQDASPPRTSRTRSEVSGPRLSCGGSGPTIPNIGTTVATCATMATEIAKLQQKAQATQEIARQLPSGGAAPVPRTKTISARCGEAAETTSPGAVSLRGASEDLRREATAQTTR